MGITLVAVIGILMVSLLLQKYFKFPSSMWMMVLGYTVSFGIVYGLGKDLHDMVDKSDEALYVSKENGRNQVTIQQI